MSVSGLVVVDKPAGMTSHDVVARLRRVYGQRRVGHAGTLDPDATGVLLVGLGSTTRLLRYLQETTKEYTATVVFGATTDTLDAAGTVTATFDMAKLTEPDVRAAAREFVGEIDQIPPMVSAIKIDGKRLHELAREGIQIERPPRRVRIDRLAVRGFRAGARPEADLEVGCSSGTYIRSLGADLGSALGGGAYVTDLRRTRVGAFTIDEAIPLDEIEARSLDRVLPPIVALRAMERVDVDDLVAAKVCHGNTFPARELLRADAGPGPFAVAHDGGLIAVYERRGAGVKPVVVLPE
jgi:tRNA pseudouridine55 synthase